VNQRIIDDKEVGPIHATEPIVTVVLEQYGRLLEEYRKKAENSQLRYDEERNLRVCEIKAKNDEIDNLRGEHSAEVNELKAENWEENRKMKQQYEGEIDREEKLHEKKSTKNTSGT